MSERVHFHSWTLDRAFTFGEWCDYLKAHPDSTSETVLTINGFEFNVHGYCRNKLVAVRKELPGGRQWFKVEIYQAPRGNRPGEPLTWHYSNDYTLQNCGGSGGYGEAETRDGAIEAGLRKIIEQLERDADWYGRKTGEAKNCETLVRMAREEIYDRAQPKLFDF